MNGFDETIDKINYNKNIIVTYSCYQTDLIQILSKSWLRTENFEIDLFISVTLMQYIVPLTVGLFTYYGDTRM